MQFMKGVGLVTSLLFCASLCSCWDYDDEDYKELFSSNKDPFVEWRVSDGNILGKIASLFGTAFPEVSVIINPTKVGLGIVNIVNKLLSFAQNLLRKPNGEKDLLNVFQIIIYRLDEIQAGIEGIHERLRFLTNGLPHMVRWEIAFDTIEAYNRGIDTLFQQFVFYQQHRERLERHTLLDFATSVISHDQHSIHSYMAKIHNMAAPSNTLLIKAHDSYTSEDYQSVQSVYSDLLRNYKRHSAKRKRRYVSERKTRDISSLRLSIFRKLLNVIENYDECSMTQTPQQLIFNFYTMLSLVQARGYIMSAFAYTILEHYKEGNFIMEKLIFDDLYTHYSKGIMTEAQKVLVAASNSFRRCDPKYHVEGETYEMITNFLQGYVENDANFNSDGSCSNYCSHYTEGSYKGCYSPETELCSKQTSCSGKVYDCRFKRNDGEVCLSNDPNRRYDWIHYDPYSYTHGKKTSYCNRLVKFYSWRYWLDECSYCYCICDDYNSPTTDRYISLFSSMANMEENRVVTGVRFVKKNRVIHIQIQDGKVAPQGQVDQKSIAWRDVDPINVKSSAFKDGRDYFTLKYEARKIDLDQLRVPEDHVVTGLRFMKMRDHVYLKMAVTPIDFTSGKLDKDATRWVSNDNIRYKTLLRMSSDDADDPRRSTLDSLVASRSNTYMMFQPTSLLKDASQLTVPFFDAQPVSPMPATWLDGVELYHKRRSGYGGFLGFKIYSYNLNDRFKNATA